jgi:hypothetical protein
MLRDPSLAHLVSVRETVSLVRYDFITEWAENHNITLSKAAYNELREALYAQPSKAN